MITELRFQNFKAWKESCPIRLAPLTVFFGANSAGKTSVAQLLLMLKQTAASPDRQGVLQFGGGRALADLGSFQDVLHGQDRRSRLEFSLQWALEKPLTVENPLARKERCEGGSLRFEAAIKADSRWQPRSQSMRYELIQDGRTTLALSMKPSRAKERGNTRSGFDLQAEGYGLKRTQGRPWKLPPPVRFYGFPDEVTAYYQNTAFAADLVLSLERLLKGVHYVGPLRESPRRLYTWSGEFPEHVGAKGERAVEAILAAGERSFNWKAKQHTNRLAVVVATQLRDMGLISSFRVEPVAKGRNEYEVLVKTGARLPEVKLTDVGFGVSQVLPVLVECLYVPARSVVIFEQPEIHLHPRVQAELADIFVDAIHAREDGRPRDCQFIVESHSEHFLRRLQRRMAEAGLPGTDGEKSLRASEAALYFVSVDDQDGAATCRELQTDDYGNIRNWPDGFFGDEMEDLVKRSEAQAKRMKSEAVA